ncbi:MAG: thioredoxin-disulfide reductase [Deltaproteobacteria bacterium]|nr:thioredoxin-disulfide reductase [Deltaproteobacteria bacterium]
MHKREENTVIIGSGPAGYTAAIYAGRANLTPLVLAGFQAGGLPGGQLMTTTDVENFPGFPDGIMGPDLMENIEAQARRCGAEIIKEDVCRVDFSRRPFVIQSSTQEVKAKSVIIATGATARRLGLPSEEKFWNAGISACAICDGATPIFRGAEIAIIGGGDTAAEEATYLTKYASQVHLLVRRGELRASKTMRDRVLNNPAITIHWHSSAVDVFGDERLRGIKLKNDMSGAVADLKVEGLFYAIGHKANTELFKGQLDLDESGYVITRPGSTETSIEGIYAAGDVQDHEFRQAVTAAASGCMAAMQAERWLTAGGLIDEGRQVREIAAAAPTTGVEDNCLEGSAALRQLFNDSGKIIMVKYGAVTCGPCRALRPILKQLRQEFVKEVQQVEIDINTDAELAQAAGITATPTVQFFKNREQIAELKGLRPKDDYRRIIKKYC